MNHFAILSPNEIGTMMPGRSPVASHLAC